MVQQLSPLTIRETAFLSMLCRNLDMVAHGVVNTHTQEVTYASIRVVNYGAMPLDYRKFIVAKFKQKFGHELQIKMSKNSSCGGNKVYYLSKLA